MLNRFRLSTQAFQTCQVFDAPSVYTVYNRQASWVTYKLERRRPAGYCIQAALAGQLELHISWDKLEKLDRPEIEREKFLDV